MSLSDKLKNSEQAQSLKGQQVLSGKWDNSSAIEKLRIIVLLAKSQ